MNPKRMLGLAIVILMALPAVARAQQDSDDITAQVVVLAALDVTGTTDLDFGSVLQSSGQVLSSDVPTSGSWTVDDVPFSGFCLFFSLPTVLENPGATGSIPITFGSQSAALYLDGVLATVFDPTAPAHCPSPTTAAVTVTLGEDANGSGSAGAGDVILNVGNVPPDTYTGVITLTAFVN